MNESIESLTLKELKRIADALEKLAKCTDNDGYFFVDTHASEGR